MRGITLLLILIFAEFNAFTQSTSFDIQLIPMNVPNLGGVQAFAYGQHNNKWLIIGGRLDGLHRRQPWASFDVAGNNNQLIVVDPIAQQVYYASIGALPISIQEQLSATNIQSHQLGNYLYLIGGYGYHASSGSRMTFPYLTAVDVPAVINAVINGQPFVNYFRQITDAQFAVTGGHLKMINDTWYLLCGNKFDGNYNPMGNPTYTQVYTNAVRRFTLTDNGTTININHLPALTDTAQLHRRDYNAVPQILPDGAQGITIFSGVFQPVIDLPYLNSVTVDSIGYSVNNSFQQYYNHYHCAVMPLFDSIANEMHNVFFGGIVQYYDSAGVLVQDNNVPFVNTIARVTRNAAGVMSEYKLPQTMPALLGAGSEFILANGVSTYPNGVIKLNDFTADTTLAGYIYGGISSTMPNIFWINDGTQSSTSNSIFKVYVIKNNPSSVHQLNQQSVSRLNLQILPNPNEGIFIVNFNLIHSSDVTIVLSDANGKILEEKQLKGLPEGNNIWQKKLRNLSKGGVYVLTLSTNYETATQKIIVDP
jgi:hypothetical protein